MRHTDAEINRFATAKARELSDGCSKTYHEIKQSLIDQLNKANERHDQTYVPSSPRSDDPGGGHTGPQGPVDEDLQPEDTSDMSVIPPPFDNPIPEVIFVRKFFAWSFSIMFLLMIALVVYSTIAGI